MQNLTPFIWYKDQAEEAALLYTSVFQNAKLGKISRYPDSSPGGMAGKAMSVSFSIDGRDYIAFNGGPHFELSPAFSIMVTVETQDEVDALWQKLTADGGQESRCGWLVDPFGLSWQIIPTALGRLMGDPDQARAGRVMQAMFKMNKIDIAALQSAYDGE